MALTADRVGQIACLALQAKLQEDGLRLNPKGVKRDVHNEAKKLGVPVQEFAEFAKLLYITAFEQTMTELEAIISSPAKVEGEGASFGEFRTLSGRDPNQESVHSL